MSIFDEPITRPRWRLTVRGMMVAVAIIAAGLGGYIAWTAFRPPARSILLVGAPRFADESDDDTETADRAVRYMRSQRLIMKSPNVLAPAAENLKAAITDLSRRVGDVVGWLRNGIQVDDNGGPTLTISMPGAPHDEQATIVDAVSSAYLIHAVAVEEQIRWDRCERLEGEYNDYRKQLAARRLVLRQAQGKPSDPEPLAAMRDEVAIFEEIVRRLGVSLEEQRIEMGRPRKLRKAERPGNRSADHQRRPRRCDAAYPDMTQPKTPVPAANAGRWPRRR